MQKRKITMSKKDSWPKTIPYLTKKDFSHGLWITDLDESERRKLGLCGNQRCMVGWVGHVFHNDSYIAENRDDGELSGPCRTFLQHLAKYAGIPEANNLGDKQLMNSVSDAFEGFGRDSYGCIVEGARNPMSAEAASKIWAKAMRACGYTQVTYINYEDPYDQ